MKVNEWVVVASRAQAKIFKRSDTTRPLQWIHTVVNKDARDPQEVDTSIPRVPPNEANVEKFAKQIANSLKVGADSHSFTRLHLFAEPHLLGRIRQNIPKSMKNIEIDWIPKDLDKATSEEIQERVS